MKPIKKVVICLVAFALIYVVCYGVIRTSRKDVSETDGKAYVIFPESPKVLYYLFGPMSAIDAAMTGTQAHLGPIE